MHQNTKNKNTHNSQMNINVLTILWKRISQSKRITNIEGRLNINGTMQAQYVSYTFSIKI